MQPPPPPLPPSLPLEQQQQVQAQPQPQPQVQAQLQVQPQPQPQPQLQLQPQPQRQPQPQPQRQPQPQAQQAPAASGPSREPVGVQQQEPHVPVASASDTRLECAAAASRDRVGACAAAHAVLTHAAPSSLGKPVGAAEEPCTALLAPSPTTARACAAPVASTSLEEQVPLTVASVSVHRNDTALGAAAAVDAMALLMPLPAVAAPCPTPAATGKGPATRIHAALSTVQPVCAEAAGLASAEDDAAVQFKSGSSSLTRIAPCTPSFSSEEWPREELGRGAQQPLAPGGVRTVEDEVQAVAEEDVEEDDDCFDFFLPPPPSSMRALAK